MKLSTLGSMIGAALHKHGDIEVKLMDNGIILDIDSIVVERDNDTQTHTAYVMDVVGRRYLEDSH